MRLAGGKLKAINSRGLHTVGCMFLRTLDNYNAVPFLVLVL